MAIGVGDERRRWLLAGHAAILLRLAARELLAVPRLPATVFEHRELVLEVREGRVRGRRQRRPAELRSQVARELDGVLERELAGNFVFPVDHDGEHTAFTLATSAPERRVCLHAQGTAEMTVSAGDSRQCTKGMSSKFHYLRVTWYMALESVPRSG